jgi:hypothetical protein
MKPVLSLQLRLRAMAESVGLDWAIAAEMTVQDFSRAVQMRREVRDSQRIALAVVHRHRRLAVAS